MVTVSHVQVHRIIRVLHFSPPEIVNRISAGCFRSLPSFHGTTPAVAVLPSGGVTPTVRAVSISSNLNPSSRFRGRPNTIRGRNSIDSMAPERRQVRAQRACTYCRQRKVRSFHVWAIAIRKRRADQRVDAVHGRTATLQELRGLRSRMCLCWIFTQSTSHQCRHQFIDGRESAITRTGDVGRLTQCYCSLG